MSAVAESITETSPNSEKVMQWTVQYRQMPKVLLRIIQHQHLAQVLSHFRHEEVIHMNNPIRLMRIQNITCHYYVLVCMSQTMRPCNRHSNQYAPLQQQVQDPLQENHKSPRSNGILMALMQYWIMEREERCMMALTEDPLQQNRAIDDIHHGDHVLLRLSTMVNYIGFLRTDMQTIVRRMKALEPDLFSPAHPDAY